MMAKEGNEGVGIAFSLQKRIDIHQKLKEERNGAPYRRFIRVRQALLEQDYDVPVRTLKKMYLKFSEADWQFEAKERKGRGRKRKLSEEGEKRLKKKLKGATARNVARKYSFEGRNGEDVKVSRQTVMRTGKKLGLVIAEPKIVRIAHYADHHMKMRIAHCEWFMKLSPLLRRGVWYSDEMSWPVTLTPNKKNNVQWCDAGKQKTTNVHRITKGAQHASFSLWWTVYYDGVVCAEVYIDMLTVKKFHQLLTSHLKPMIAKAKHSRSHLRFFYHDHVTNSSTIYDVTKMNKALGEGLWLPFAPKLCREQVDVMQMPAIERNGRKIKAHSKAKVAAKKVCECNTSEGYVKSGQFVASSAPDLNLIEYANGQLRQIVWEEVAEGREEWKGSVQKKMDVVKRCINLMNEKKRYWWKLFEHHHLRCKRIVEAGGDIIL